MLMVAVPKRRRPGVIESVQFGPLPPKTRLELGTNAAADEKADSVRSSGSDSGSEILNATEMGISSYVLCGAIDEIAGGSFTGCTSNSKLVLARPPSPSVT